MSDITTLNDELDDYEEQLGEIAQVLLDAQLTVEEKIAEIEEIVFSPQEEDEG